MLLGELEEARVDVNQVQTITHLAIRDLALSFRGLSDQSQLQQESVLSLIRNLTGGAETIDASTGDSMSIDQFAGETERILHYFVDTVTSTPARSPRFGIVFNIPFNRYATNPVGQQDMAAGDVDLF